MTKPTVEHMPDSSVTAQDDQRLRDLLCLCYTGPQDHVFKQRRYFDQPPQERWIIRDGDRIIAHNALHVKKVHAGGQTWKVAGVAEMAVHPDYRGKGLALAVLRAGDQWAKAQGLDAVLVPGGSTMYEKNGYVSLRRPLIITPHNSSIEKTETWDLRVLLFKDKSWPEGPVDLKGPLF